MIVVRILYINPRKHPGLSRPGYRRYGGLYSARCSYNAAFESMNLARGDLVTQLCVRYHQ